MAGYIYNVQVSLPTGKPDMLGLNVLDEPRAKQSDPTVLDLQLRTLAKQTTVKPMVRIRHTCTTVHFRLVVANRDMVYSC